MMEIDIKKVLEDNSRIFVAGHRGIRALYPENTLLSFEKAFEANVDMIEIDLRESADGRIVLMHDADVARTTDGAGLVADKTLDELKALDAGKGFDGIYKGQRIPELCELLKILPDGMMMNVEIKDNSRNFADKCIRAIDEAGILGACVFTCFNAGITSYITKKYALPVQGFPGERMYDFVEGDDGSYSDLYAVGIEMGDLTKVRVEEFISRGIQPWCFCPDTQELVEYAIACGVRLMTCNDPFAALKRVRR